VENQQLNIKLLETAIGAMQRNRALLFTINLIAALVIVLVYLERFSIDKAQMEGHLIAYHGRCNELRKEMEKTSRWIALGPDGRNQFKGFPGEMEETSQWDALSQEDKIEFNGCSELDKVSEVIHAQIGDTALLKRMGKSLFKLYQNRNDIATVKLGTADVTPLGIGLQVPRNDMYIILGVLLVTLYTWLAFSFNQHARITTKINRMFPEPDDGGKETQATVNDLVDLNFLFRTTESRRTRWAVKTLYWLAPISMTLASINNSIPDTSEGFRQYFETLVRVPLLAQWVLTIVLWGIGYSVHKSDEVANIEPTITPDNQSASHKTHVRTVRQALISASGKLLVALKTSVRAKPRKDGI
jgi:hypothetical protein